ncbi:MAG: hypothetical protein JXJ20_11655 [Anaerolineae bacterium]|nr:hypothetical protein [Anaerolineae bacterium]
MNHITQWSIRFGKQRIASAIRVAPDCPPEEVLAALKLPSFTGVIVMHGGAGGMDADTVTRTRRFLATSLAPLAEARRLLVIDGGTYAGSVAAMGDARRDVGGTYPLVGVCPMRFASYPGGPSPDDDHFPLDASHTHFVLVEGDEFGVESELLVGLLQAAGKPGAALIINGGEIVANEALAHAQQGNALITVRGTGRVADELADPNSERRAALPPDSRLEIANLHAPDMFTALLERVLT